MSVSALLHLAPAIAMLALLLARHYPGEHRIAALATRALRRRPAPRRARVPDPRRRPLLTGPAGSAVLAFELAGRAPPLPG